MSAESANELADDLILAIGFFLLQQQTPNFGRNGEISFVERSDGSFHPDERLVDEEYP